jgi:hypothetical protein
MAVPPNRRLDIERLEDRAVPAGVALADATPLNFVPQADGSAAAVARNTITTPDKVDVYAVSLAAGGRLDAAVAAVPPSIFAFDAVGGNLDATVRIFDADGNEVFRDDRVGNGSLSFTAAESGTYYVAVSARAGDNYDPAGLLGDAPDSATGTYDLTVRTNLPPAAPLPDDPTARIDNVIAPGGSDAFAFVINTPGRLTARVLPADGSMLNARVSLFDGLGRLLLRSDDADLDLGIRPGSYTLVVEGQGGTGGGYRLSLDFAPGQAPAAPSDPGFDQPEAGTLPASVAVADFNGDGRPDVATANRGYGSKGRGSVTVRLGQGDGSLGPATSDFNTPINFGTPTVLRAADVNRDGRLDLVVGVSAEAYVTVLLGRGDGTFGELPFGQVFFGQTDLAYVTDLEVIDLNGDGRLDLVVSGYETSGSDEDDPFGFLDDLGAEDIEDLLDGGDLIPPGAAGFVGFVRVASGLAGGGFGEFEDVPVALADAGAVPRGVEVADVDGDGKLDLLVTDSDVSFYDNTDAPGTVIVLRGNGEGTFNEIGRVDAGESLQTLRAADVDRDGDTDLVLVNDFGSDQNTGTLSVRLNDGRGHFTPGPSGDIPLGRSPGAVAVGDVNGDGRADLVVTDASDFSATVLLGTGGGAFQVASSFRAGGRPGDVALADFDGDGKLDVVAAQSGYDRLTVALGNGDGSFRDRSVPRVGLTPFDVVSADFNGDGRPDLATADRDGDTVTVRLGNGDGTTRQSARVAASDGPIALAAGDLNRDGRPDLVVADRNTPSAGVLLGNGDGTFRPASFLDFLPADFRLNGPLFPSGLTDVAVVDLDRDGFLDIVVSGTALRNFDSPAVDFLAVRRGRGDGTFGELQLLNADLPGEVSSFQAADLDGDGDLDLVATANRVTNGSSDPFIDDEANSDGTVALLENVGGTFVLQSNPELEFPGLPGFAATLLMAVVAADLDGDGDTDLAVTANDVFDFGDNVGNSNEVRGYLYVFLRQADGSLALQEPVVINTGATAVVAADVTGDGVLDLVTADADSGEFTLLTGAGDGTFTADRNIAEPGSARGLVVADFNGDGRPDLATADAFNDTVAIFPGLGGGAFADPVAQTEARNTPLVADLDGDGVSDTAVLDGGGNILVRRGIAGPVPRFAPPVVINPGRPARDLVLVTVGGQTALAAADAAGDTVSLYRFQNGTFVRTSAFATGGLPVRLAAADLDGDGDTDLVSADALGNSVTVAFQTAPGQFGTVRTLAAGLGPVDLALLDVDADGRLDVAAAGPGGLVNVLLQGPDGFATAQAVPFRAGATPTSLVYFNDTLTQSTLLAADSLDQTAALAHGDFTGDGIGDIVAVNRGSRSLSVLAGNGLGGFANPTRALTLPTAVGLESEARAGAVVTGDFDGDGRLDLAVLMQDSGRVFVYMGNGDGTFRMPTEARFRVAAGSSPTGLTLADVSSPSGLGPDGVLDLVVGNSFGDVLLLPGNGDGTFSEFRRTDAGVALAVTDLGNGFVQAVVGVQGEDRISVLVARAGTDDFVEVFADSAALNANLQAPSSVRMVQLDGPNDPFLDLVVAAGGSNSVLVYKGVGDGQFVLSQRLFAGTDPSGLEVADFDGDGDLDIAVANRGSNDISVFRGQLDAAGNFTASDGARLASGGVGPVGVTASDLNGDGLPELLATNSATGTVAALTNVGQAFFNDVTPTIVNLGSPVVGGASIDPTTGRGVAVTAAGTLLAFDARNATAGVTTAFSLTAGLGATAAAFQSLAGGGFAAVVGSAGGVFTLLTSADGLNFTLAGTLTDTDLINPSALQILERDGLLEVYATTLGVDRPFVLTFGLDGPGGDPLAPLPPGAGLDPDAPDGGGAAPLSAGLTGLGGAGPAVASVTLEVPGATLVLVQAALFTVGPEASAADALADDEADAGTPGLFAAFLPAVVAVDGEGDADGDGGGDEEPPPEEPPAPNPEGYEEYVAGVEEGYERLGLERGVVPAAAEPDAVEVLTSVGRGAWAVAEALGDAAADGLDGLFAAVPLTPQAEPLVVESSATAPPPAAAAVALPAEAAAPATEKAPAGPAAPASAGGWAAFAAAAVAAVVRAARPGSRGGRPKDRGEQPA